MLKSSGSSYQFEARLGGRSHALGSSLRTTTTGHCCDTYHKTDITQSAIDAVLRQPTTLVSRRCGALVSVRCVSSLQATQLERTRPNRKKGTVTHGWDGPSFRACEPQDPTQWAQAAKTRRVRTTGTQTGMLPGI